MEPTQMHRLLCCLFAFPSFLFIEIHAMKRSSGQAFLMKIFWMNIGILKIKTRNFGQPWSLFSKTVYLVSMQPWWSIFCMFLSWTHTYGITYIPPDKNCSREKVPICILCILYILCIFFSVAKSGYFNSKKSTETESDVLKKNLWLHTVAR